MKCDGQCGKRPTLDFPIGVSTMARAFIEGGGDRSEIPVKGARQFFCDLAARDAAFCARLNDLVVERVGS